MSKIPSVDLSNFLSSNNDLKRDFVKKTGKAFQEIGFLSLKGHFLSKNCSENLYNQIKKFFDLPKNIKKKYEFDGVKGQRGYTSYGKEHAKGKKEGDLKEFWHFGQYYEKERENLNYPKNINIDEFPEFNTVGFETYKALEKTGVYVLRAIALFLNAPVILLAICFSEPSPKIESTLAVLPPFNP